MSSMTPVFPVTSVSHVPAGTWNPGGFWRVMAHHRCRPFRHQPSGMLRTWAGHWRGGQGAAAMTHPWWPWRPCWQPVGAGGTCVPGRCCMAGTAIRRGPSPLGAGGCGGGWRPSPLGCTAALSTVGGCAMLPTASTRWPGGNAEPPCVPGVTCCPPPRKAPVGPQGAAETFTGSWSSLGGSLGVSRALRGVLGSSGGSRGSAGTFAGSWGGLEESLGVSWNLHGVLGCSGGPLGDPGGKRGPSEGAGGLRQAPQRPP